MYNPFQNSSDEYFPTSDYIENNLIIENEINWADYGLAGAGLEGVNYTNNNAEINNNGRRNNGNDDNEDEQKKKKKKKSAHKEIERQRRQEMSGLYSALRSELPAEYIKGKRSASDHIAEAVNYIKDLEKSVKELSIRRDELRASPEWANPTDHVGGSTNSASRAGSVMINPHIGGLGIQIDVPYEHDQSFSLSSALHVLYEEGLSVSSCTSTNVNDRIIHNIICEVMDMTSINFSWLQQRLINLVS